MKLNKLNISEFIFFGLRTFFANFAMTLLRGIFFWITFGIAGHKVLHFVFDLILFLVLVFLRVLILVFVKRDFQLFFLIVKFLGDFKAFGKLSFLLQLSDFIWIVNVANHSFVIFIGHLFEFLDKNNVVFIDPDFLLHGASDSGVDEVSVHQLASDQAASEISLHLTVFLCCVFKNEFSFVYVCWFLKMLVFSAFVVYHL